MSTRNLGLTVVAAGATIVVGGWLLSKMRSEEKPKPIAAPANASKGAAAADGELAPEDGVWIYFGSQSGTAQQFSEELEEQSQEQGLQLKVVDLEEFDEDVFVRHRCVVLVLATYGEGDPTDNAVEFFKWIQDESHADDLLSDVKFTVMGLGNRQYVHFNSCGKLADGRMEQLGATRIYDLGVGDDDQNLEEDWEQWKDNGLWPALQTVCGVDDVETKEPETVELTAQDVLSKLPLKLSLYEGDAKPIDPMVHAGGADVVGKWYFQAHEAEIVQCVELRQKSDASKGLTTKHIEFDIKNFPAMEWKTADNLEILPSNAEADVAWFADRLKVAEKLDSKLTFLRAGTGDKIVRQPFPVPCTVRTALALYCDLSSAPVKSTAKKYAAFVTDHDDQAAVLKIVDDRESYEIISKGATRISLREFFELYLATAEIDLGTFLQLCQRQKNRPYTIASSYRDNPKQIGVCVSMVKEELKPLFEIFGQLASAGHGPPRADAMLKSAEAGKVRGFDGACSTMLCTRVATGDKCWIATHTSGFRLPKNASTPIVMVGAGTGVAPFHGFLREFWAEGGIRPNTQLFFGCWKGDEDYIYHEEFEKAVKHSPAILKEVVTAFSREQSQKVYVQHRFRERATEMTALAKQGAHFYVCGSVNMGAAIRKELAEVLGGEDQMKQLQTDGRFYEELW